jgi:hypothetical protein
MIGLRTQECQKFRHYFSIVQDAAAKKNSVFFLDAGDGREFETDSMEGEDLMGWLIPKEKVPEFEAIWEKGDVSDDWSEYFGFAVWKKDADLIIEFQI